MNIAFNVQCDPKYALVEGRTCHALKRVRVWTTDTGGVFLDAYKPSRSSDPARQMVGKYVAGGFFLNTAAMIELCRKFLEALGWQCVPPAGQAGAVEAQK